MMGSKPNNWETAAPTGASQAHPVKQNNPLPVLWSLGGAFGCSSVWERLSRAGTRRGLPEATDAILLKHTCTCAQSLSLENDCLSLVAVILGADEGTSWCVEKRKLCMKMSFEVTNCAEYSGYLWRTLMTVRGSLPVVITNFTTVIHIKPVYYV